MIVVSDRTLAERLRSLRNHGLAPPGSRRLALERTGLNARMTEMQAALGRAQLGRLEQFIAQRATLAGLYRERLAGLEWITPPSCPDDARHVWQAYVVLIDERLDRDELLERLRQQGVEATLGTYALSAQPRYRGKPSQPNSLRAYQRSLALPMHGRLAQADVEEVVACLEKAVALSA
jgi:dTDP-4-amino-4,6-dideoxygalactose transaminase